MTDSPNYTRYGKNNSYQYATVKFNSGIGALLCTDCNIIISYGFAHEDKFHYCEACEAYKDHQR